MAGLAILAVLMYGTATRLLLATRYPGLHRSSDVDLRKWVSNPTLAPECVRETIGYTQDQVLSLREIEGRFREVEAAHTSAVDRNRASLAVMVVAAPLFGLLGTVLGMLLTFKAIGIGGSTTSDVIARGVSEALVATQTGMMVALPGLVAAFVVKRRRDEHAAFLARLESISLRYFRSRFSGMTRVVARRSSRSASAPIRERHHEIPTHAH
jgi:biopolymer transport protein ExbB